MVAAVRLIRSVLCCPCAWIAATKHAPDVTACTTVIHRDKQLHADYATVLAASSSHTLSDRMLTQVSTAVCTTEVIALAK